MDRISLDYNEAMAASAGAAGLRDEELSAQWLRAREAVAALRERREEDAAYLDLPRDAGALAEAKAAAADLSARFDDLVVLGIGGSSLGAKAIASALLPPFSALRPREARAGRGMRLFFPDNSDPDTFAALLDTVDLARTAFAVVTKSGGTAETMAQFLIVRERLRARFGDEGYRARIVAVTDPAQGALRRIAGEEGLRTLAIPPPVGGRFSALTAVGLLPAAAAGIDVDALCAGAAAMAERALEPEPSRNPAAVLAALFVAMDQIGRAHV